MDGLGYVPAVAAEAGLVELWQQLNEQLVKELKQPDQYDHLQQSPAHTPVPVPFRL
jgi:hypothetical protein